MITDPDIAVVDVPLLPEIVPISAILNRPYISINAEELIHSALNSFF
jgi:hypothetical protein